VIWFAPYELIARRRLNARAETLRRRGALIRVDDGFADVHPWPELGDAPLDEQLARLARGETTPLTRASLRFAATDAAARREGRSVFDGLTIPESHWPGADPPPAFDTVKIKCGLDFDARSLPDGVRLRLDFNATLDADAFAALAESLPRERVDFIEDPCPYDAAVWRALQIRTRLRLALDRGEAMDGVDVLVMKPAVQELVPRGRELVVTSYMDHAVGQLGAAYVAANDATSDRCGLATHVLYEPDAFFDRLRLDGARLVPPAGNGFGFDDLLDAQPWRALT
jgi:O-succinylbenzoate synthase